MAIRIIVVALALTCIVPTLAQEPSVETLASSIKDFSSADPECEPFSFRLAIAPTNSAGGMQLDTCWRGDNHYSLLVSECRSGCPLALFVDDKFLFLDVVSGRLLKGSGLKASIGLYAEERDDHESVVVNWSLKASEKAPSVKLKLRSLLPQSQSDVQLVSLPDQTCLQSTDRSTVRFYFTKDQTPALTSIQTLNKEDRNILAEITALKFGDNAEYIDFPNLEGIGITVEEFDHQDSIAAILEVYTQILRAVAGVAAVSNTECRSLSIFPKDVDWELVKQRKDTILPSVASRLAPKQIGIAKAQP